MKKLSQVMVAAAVTSLSACQSDVEQQSSSSFLNAERGQTKLDWNETAALECSNGRLNAELAQEEGKFVLSADRNGRQIYDGKSLNKARVRGYRNWSKFKDARGAYMYVSNVSLNAYVWAGSWVSLKCEAVPLKPVFEGQISDARYNASSDKIEVDVVYGGGCEEHKFELEISEVCLQTYPVQCGAELLHVEGRNDPCDALISETLSFPVNVEKPAIIRLDSFEIEVVEQEEIDAWFSVKGSAAKAIYDSMSIYVNDSGVAHVEGKGSIFCEQTFETPDFPEGAQGIVAPSGHCSAYPHVDFPEGALGIVAPWFNISGYAAYELYDAMPIRDTGDGKSLVSVFDIKCTASRCDFNKLEAADELVLKGDAADDLFEALNARAVGGVKTVSGNGDIYCEAVSNTLPDGAQGIVGRAMASCTGYPNVTFPDGAQGMVMPWFRLKGLSGFDLYAVLPGSRPEKSLKGDLEIECIKSAMTCTIRKL